MRVIYMCEGEYNTYIDVHDLCTNLGIPDCDKETFVLQALDNEGFYIGRTDDAGFAYVIINPEKLPTNPEGR